MGENIKFYIIVTHSGTGISEHEVGRYAKITPELKELAKINWWGIQEWEFNTTTFKLNRID